MPKAVSISSVQIVNISALYREAADLRGHAHVRGLKIVLPAKSLCVATIPVIVSDARM
jgi:hypothetical protein